MSDKPQDFRLRVVEADEGDLALTTAALQFKLMLPHFTDEQRAQAVDHINALLEVDELRHAAPTPGQPTPGLRIITDNDYDGPGANVVRVDADYGLAVDGPTPLADQSKADAAYINGLIEADERRRAHLLRQAQAPEGQGDLLVDLGDMTRASLNHIALDAEYEAMVEDIIGNVNHIVLQGVPPIRAVFAMSQAFAIVLGYALRANMNFEVAKAMITQVMKSATKNEQMLRIITKQ